MANTNHWSYIKNKLRRQWNMRKGRQLLNHVSLLMDTRCNLKCNLCPESLFKKQHDFKQFISKEEAAIIAEQLGERNCLHCTIFGDEPLLRPDLADILAIFRKHGIFTSLATNDFYLDSRLMRELKKAGLREINMELFGAHAAAHDRFMVKPGSFANIFRIFQLARENKIKSVLSVMPTHENIANGEFRKIIGLAEQKKIRVDVYYPALVGEYTGEYNHLLTKDELNYVRHFFQLNHVKSDFTHDGKIYRCPAGWETINILPDGSVCPCKFINISFGNILTEPLSEIMPRIWSTKIFTGQASRCLVGESLMFNRIYLQPVFNASSIPLYYRNHLMFIEGEPLIRFYVNSSGRIIEKSEDVALEKIKTLREL